MVSLSYSLCPDVPMCAGETEGLSPAWKEAENSAASPKILARILHP